MNHRTSKRIMIFIVITVLFNSFTISVTATPYIQTDRPRVVKTISLSHPIDIAINMSAKRAYVVSADDDTRDRLLIIDSDSYAVVKERFIDNGASVIAVNPNTGNLFLGYTFPSSYILVLDSALNIIHRLDTAIINMLATGQGQTLAVDPSEGYI